jgi:hypothetical protein
MKLLPIVIHFCLAVATLSCSVSRGQATSSVPSVIASVEDRKGEVIPKARITAFASGGAGRTFRAVADESGKGSLDLPPDRYDLIIEASGFETATTHISVQPLSHQDIGVALNVGQCNDCVTVQALDPISPESVPVPTSLSPEGCEPPDLSPTAASYQDALEIAAKLSAAGVNIICTVESNMDQVFKGQKGAALYRTNKGSVNALFLLSSKNFIDLKITEHRKNGEYRYSFHGTPRSSVHYVQSQTPYHFIKHGNILFCIQGSAESATTLQSALVQ